MSKFKNNLTKRIAPTAIVAIGLFASACSNTSYATPKQTTTTAPVASVAFCENIKLLNSVGLQIQKLAAEQQRNTGGDLGKQEKVQSIQTKITNLENGIDSTIKKAIDSAPNPNISREFRTWASDISAAKSASTASNLSPGQIHSMVSKLRNDSKTALSNISNCK